MPRIDRRPADNSLPKKSCGVVLSKPRTCLPFRLPNHWLETLLLLNGTLQQVPLKLLKSLVLMVHIGISCSFVHCGEDHE
jgi:hypothetical protein